MQFLDLHAKFSFRGYYLHYLAQANKVQVNSIVEVGTWYGTNAAVLRSLFPKAHLYLIDPWVLTPEYQRGGKTMSDLEEDYEKAYRKVCSCFEHDPMVTLLKMTSVEGAKKVPDGIDLVFIDGDHSYEHVKEDIATWSKKVRPGCLLTGHDYFSNFPGVIKAVNESLEGKFVVGRDTVWATMI